MHWRYWALAAGILALNACTTVPARVDASTMASLGPVVARQKAAPGHHALIGLYRVAFHSPGRVDTPATAKAPKGDMRFAAVQRGAEIDFVALSGISGFPGWSDQGSSFSINFQGSAFWSFPASGTGPVFMGRNNNLVTTAGPGTCEAQFAEGFLRMVVMRPTLVGGQELETFFLSANPE